MKEGAITIESAIRRGLCAVVAAWFAASAVAQDGAPPGRHGAPEPTAAQPTQGAAAERSRADAARNARLESTEVDGATRPVPGIDGLSDPLVASAIESELWEARGVDANDIDVEVAQGVVTLTGTVDNILESERAVRIASLTRGVASVVDRLEVAESGRSDATIERDVVTALTTDPATDSWEIFTAVTGGRVTLSGTVESNAERRLAERVAKSVAGVRSVDNRLRTSSDGTRTDAEIASDIRALLDWDVRLDTRLLTVDVAAGEVTLGGAVASDFERDLATAIAWVAGVSAVDASGVEVEWWRHDAMQRDRVPAEFTDMQVRGAIERALASDPRVASFDIRTQVENGTATLRGTVDNLKARQAAAQTARNTVAVRRVENYFKVRPETPRGDAELAADVRAALARNALLQADDIAVAVDGGQVRLSGTVVSPFERAHAADVVARVNGVTNVVNGLRISYDGPDYAYGYGDWDPLLYDYDYDREYDYTGVYGKTDREIEEDIEDELFWSPYVDADEVRVSVEDGAAARRACLDGAAAALTAARPTARPARERAAAARARRRRAAAPRRRPRPANRRRRAPGAGARRYAPESRQAGAAPHL